ncbi:unnamed protein product [Arabidopsis thaliana]|uniref:(thale cress) hypothetical protein n=1 Tax=Arabidopsis thaliana TaxID=3702 RepID=A0A7G2EER0_ARATH|nr:unnamed protein product [Arabidopsis thaliana]
MEEEDVWCHEILAGDEPINRSWCLFPSIFTLQIVSIAPKIEVFGDDGATSKLSKKDEIVIWL